MINKNATDNKILSLENELIKVLKGLNILTKKYLELNMDVFTEDGQIEEVIVNFTDKKGKKDFYLLDYKDTLTIYDMFRILNKYKKENDVND